MIISFKNQGTEDIFNGKVTKSALRLCTKKIWKIAIRKLDQLDSVLSLDELRIPADSVHSFRSNPSTDSDAFRPLIPF
jgi:hypothetical protein